MASFSSAVDYYLRSFVIKFLQLPPLAKTCCTEEVLGATCRVATAFTAEHPPLVQLALAIEALEREDYLTWPPLLPHFIPQACSALVLAMAGPEPLALQRFRYAELHHAPHLLAQLTHGFTPRLLLSDRQSFIDALLRAGRRELPRADEANAPDEDGVLHVALSYKHAHDDHQIGKISRETAEEAYEVICDMPFVPQSEVVRVWIDQNLHRYPEQSFGPWYERGLLPYAVLPVVSALGDAGGFGIGRTRPWIWVESSMAVGGGGVNCRRDLHNTLPALFCIPDGIPGITGTSGVSAGDGQSGGMNMGQEATIRRKMVRGRPADSLFFGKFASVEDCLRKALVAVSLCTPGILDHAGYPHAAEFWPFVRWARMQLLHLRPGHGLAVLNSAVLEETCLERLAWLKGLPYLQSSFEKLGDPFLRVEADRAHYEDVVDLLLVSNACFEKDGLYKVVAGGAESRQFYFQIVGERIFFDVNPALMMQNVTQPFPMKPRSVAEKVRQISESRGSYTLWDHRFPRGEAPQYRYCASVFNLDDELSHRRGEVDADAPVTFGDTMFRPHGFAVRWDHAIRVFQARRGATVRSLGECDIMCLRALRTEHAARFVDELMDDKIFDSATRILHAEKNMIFAEWPGPACISSSGENMWRACTSYPSSDNCAEGSNHISVGHSVVAEGLHHFALHHAKIGLIRHTFETRASREELRGSISLKFSGENVEDLFQKLRLILGSPEFDGYSRRGLSLGPYIEPEEQDKIFPKAIRLQGGEFHRCYNCGRTFSPINRRLCTLACSMRTRAILVEWGGQHDCNEIEHDRVVLKRCQTCRSFFSPIIGRKVALFADRMSKRAGFSWMETHSCPDETLDLNITGIVG